MKKIFVLLMCLTVGMAAACSCTNGAEKSTENPGNDPENPEDPEPEDPEHEPRCYYVSVDGSDTAEGLIDTPMRSISEALKKTGPGDTVFVRGGTYSQRVAFTKSGVTDKRIVLKAFEGETPLISGEGMTVSGTDALITVSNVKNVTVEGFEVAWLITSKPGVEPNGIIVSSGSNNVTIRGNHVHHIESNAALSEGRSAHAILVIGNTETALRNIVVEGNTIHDCKTGYSENLTINGYVDGFTIKGNEVYNCENIGIDAAGGYAANTNISLNYARNGVISENIVYNIENSRGPIGGYGAIGIYADGSRNITMERNRVFKCDRGIGIVSETDNFPTSNCIVRNNLIYDCWRTGIYMGGYLGYTGGGSDNCYIVNNTLYGNNKVVGYYNEIEGEIRLTEHCKNNFVYNNLICSTRPDDLFVHKYTSTGSGNLFDNNHYSGPGKWMWGYQNSNAVSDFAVWRTTVGGDANSFRSTEPLFSGVTADRNADFSIPSSSPAKNTGKVLAAYFAGTVDFAGNPRVVDGKISIGAFQ